MPWIPDQHVDLDYDDQLGVLSEKTSVADDDRFLMEDSAASYAKKFVKASNLPAGGSGGGSATVPGWMTRLAQPLSTHADDDEFNGAGLGGWTEVDPSGTTTWTEQDGVASVKFSGQASGDLAGLIKAMTPTVAPVTIQTAIRHMDNTSSNTMIGLCFADGLTDTDDLLSIVSYAGASAAIMEYRHGTFTAATTGTGGHTWESLHEWAPAPFLYLRLIWKTTNTFAYSVSPDGVSWTDFGGSDLTHALAPTHFGLIVSKYGQPGDPVASFEYFRVTETDLSV